MNECPATVPGWKMAELLGRLAAANTRIAELEAMNLDLCTARDDEDTLREERDVAEEKLADCAKTCGGLEYRLEQAQKALLPVVPTARGGE